MGKFGFSIVNRIGRLCLMAIAAIVFLLLLPVLLIGAMALFAIGTVSFVTAVTHLRQLAKQQNALANDPSSAQQDEVLEGQFVVLQAGRDRD